MGRTACTAAIAAKASALAAEFLHKDPKVTGVIVEEVAADRWFCGDCSLAEQGLASFWLDIKITDSTNTKDEKAAFIAQTFDAMEAILGRLQKESYVLMHDVRGYAYGFGGVTQEQRHIDVNWAHGPSHDGRSTVSHRDPFPLAGEGAHTLGA